ncbi:outer membrane receptor for ferrienterochelin and colicin [Pseudoduganella lurida]|uniref:Outer membrane receptor for ferrienterochelin and colicin n=1 Tax=Pseudoduganella lurida TaxID=1036180 RepID=A0A562RM10_9BURK|nr:TonB-dependent receptor [Pseudoduganella lurida]TWI70077.1 outer membrane receptor for ferrienterochelin and colicin [Pseudoduganella lurida]
MNVRLIPILLLATGSAALAQQQGKDAPVKAQPAEETAAKAIQQVEIKAQVEEYDPRRDDTASKTVLTNAEIMKYGDTNVFDVLKRAPGVTVVGNSIRMRGLGNYTQILVNGERPPPGFSLDNLPPEQIEKIEVIRAASAEYSMQAIAGTINIVLKKVVAKAQRDVRLSINHGDNQRDGLFLGTLADRTGNLSWFLNTVLGRNLRQTPGRGRDNFTTPQGTVVQLRDWRRLNRNDGTFAGLQPRLSWKLPGDDQLLLSGYAQFLRSGGDSVYHYDVPIGSFGSPDYVDYRSGNAGRSAFYGAEANWIAKLKGGKLDAKIGVSRSHSTNDSRSLASTVDRVVELRRDADTSSDASTVSSTGKYTRSLFDGHALAAGWEINRQESEDDILRVEGILGTAPRNIPEHFKPRVLRYAAYAQDEWNVTKNWSVYLGARWEAIRTDSEGTGLDATRSRNHVLSPVAQTLYKFPDKSGRQLRLALTRTYKAPTMQQLTARRYEAIENTRFNPDSSGNPDLQPELANGIDLTYEHFFAPSALFSVGTSQRRIRDYIRTRLTQDARGLWLNQPLNDGNATVRTLDFELKLPLKLLLKDGPNVDLRASVNRNWSQVETVPGPQNRLDQQVPLSANLGIDYRADRHNVGTSFAYRQGTPVRTSAEQTIRLFQRRDLDAYWLYKYTPGVQLRVSANNLLGEDNDGFSCYEDANGVSRQTSRTPDSVRIGANLELKF